MGRNIMRFLLHIRHKDMSKPLRVPFMSCFDLLHETDYQEYTFNNQVMQILLELSWIQKNMKATDGQAQAPPGKGNNGKSNDMSIDYARFLAQLLMMDSATANLKAA